MEVTLAQLEILSKMFEESKEQILERLKPIYILK